VSERRVVITGVGLVTPLGIGAADFWSALVEGRSAVARANLVDAEAEPRHPVARVPDLEIRAFVSNRKLLRVMCESDRYALAAAQMAVADGGGEIPPPQRRGAFVGTRKELAPYEMVREPILASLDEEGHLNSRRLGERGFPEIPPLALVSGMPNGCLFALSLLHSIKGSGTNLIGSGDIGIAAIGAAYRAIQAGQVEWALAGSHDTGVNRWDYADFYALGLLSTRNGDPSQIVKPFDRRRDGFVLGEGAGVIVLEELDSALARGAQVLAEISGHAQTCEAVGLLQLQPDGGALAQAMETAIGEAGLAPEAVDYVNAYGAATVVGDRTEARALSKVFGGRRRGPLVSGIKGGTGHLLAASGAVELGATVLALQHQTAPPTLNLNEPEPEFALEFVPHRARKADIETAITISRGIGGQNAVAVLRRWEP